MIIHGNYAGGIFPKPDWNQQDASKADFIRGKETVELALAAKQPKHRTAAVTLTAAGWASSSQSVACAGMTQHTTIIVSAAPADYEAYAKAGIYCAAQGQDALTFRCKSTPSASLTANILILD